jgi:hypothetical protein
MFLNHFKELITKKLIKRSLKNVNHSTADTSIKKVGIIFDENYFYEKKDLLNELQKKGIGEIDCSIIVFRNKIKKNEVYHYPYFTYKHLDWTGSINKKEIQDFMNQPFDLLINYYDTEKAAILAVSSQSKAHFKVGFSSVDKRLNHFMISTNAENYKVFVDELFKYLKILNKI